MKYLFCALFACDEMSNEKRELTIEFNKYADKTARMEEDCEMKRTDFTHESVNDYEACSIIIEKRKLNVREWLKRLEVMK